MALAAEAALTAVELLDAGWSRLTRSKTRSQQAEEQAALEERALTLEGELAKEKVEARKLQAAIEEYKNLLLKVHQDRGLSFDLLDNAASSEAGTAELIRLVEEKVNSPAFLDHLLAPPDTHVILSGDAQGAPQPVPGSASASSGSSSSAATSSSGSSSSGSGSGRGSGSCSGDGSGSGRVASSGSGGQEEIPTEEIQKLPVSGGGASADAPRFSTRVINSGGLMEVCIDEDEDAEECWQWVTAREMKGGIQPTREPCSGLEGEEDYELVEAADVVDGISLVLARFIVSHPDYKGLSAEELQKAMSAGFKDLKGKGVMRTLWDWSKLVYKASRWGTAAYNVYRHPLMVRAVLLALVSSTRIILGFTLI